MTAAGGGGATGMHITQTRLRDQQSSLVQDMLLCILHERGVYRQARFTAVCVYSVGDMERGRSVKWRLLTFLPERLRLRADCQAPKSIDRALNGGIGNSKLLDEISQRRLLRVS